MSIGKVHAILVKKPVSADIKLVDAHILSKKLSFFIDGIMRSNWGVHYICAYKDLLADVIISTKRAQIFSNYENRIVIEVDKCL